MGEYVKYNGQEVKIGTCEDMYYLRADQVHLVQHTEGNVHPVKDGEAGAIRFRFPWPSEDSVQPGAFDEPFKKLGLRGLSVPEGVEHYKVQFTAPGYVLSLPCPESKEGQAFDVHRNGFSGSVAISQQKWFEGRLITVCECGGCGAKYRLETWEQAKPIIEAVLKLGKERARDNNGGRITDKCDPWYQKVADRIAAGYKKGGD